MDYSKLSDFEINKAVFVKTQYYDEVIDKPVRDGSAVHWGDGCNWREFDPCNNPTDAWPIIVDSKISLHHYICKWDADSLVYDKKYKNGFFIFSSCSDVGDISSRGALRAAMIVFLMMQDAKNG